ASPPRRPSAPSPTRRRATARSPADPPAQPKQLAPSSPCGAHAVAVQNLERRAQPGKLLLVVGEPPRRTEPPPVDVDVLHRDAFVEAVLRLRAPEAGRLDAAPARLAGAERVAVVVDPDHAGLDAVSYAPRARQVARPDARAETERGIVREPDRIVLVL